VNAGLLVIMGSGETAPTMVKPHREIFTRVDGECPAVMLDTPYGFQENADDISGRAVGYFDQSVGRKVGVVGWRTPPEPGLPRERALAALRDAGWLFAGPGSPTYALRQWVGTEIPDLLAGVLAADGVVLFASAAALTLGSHVVPVYEIYKAGTAPHWEPGLDLVHAVTGMPAVVIPHFDNAEGGHHDTRFCYLGERRLAVLERELPDGTFILGVDEHTAVLLDLGARAARVIGNGVLTVRRRGAVRTYPAGSLVGFDELTTGAVGGGAVGGGAVGEIPTGRGPAARGPVARGLVGGPVGVLVARWAAELGLQRRAEVLPVLPAPPARPATGVGPGGALRSGHGTRHLHAALLRSVSGISRRARRGPSGPWVRRPGSRRTAGCRRTSSRRPRPRCRRPAPAAAT